MDQSIAIRIYFSEALIDDHKDMRWYGRGRNGVGADRGPVYCDCDPFPALEKLEVRSFQVIQRLPAWRVNEYGDAG